MKYDIFFSLVHTNSPCLSPVSPLGMKNGTDDQIVPSLSNTIPAFTQSKQFVIQYSKNIQFLSQDLVTMLCAWVYLEFRFHLFKLEMLIPVDQTHSSRMLPNSNFALIRPLWIAFGLPGLTPSESKVNYGQCQK